MNVTQTVVIVAGIGSGGYDAAAVDYFTRAAALGGDFDRTAINAAYTPAYVKAAINAFVAGCKTDLIWTKLTEVYLMAGVSFGGLMAKLKYSSVATLTNVGPFVSGDYVGAGSGAGLVGDGSVKYLNTNLMDNTLVADSKSFSVYRQNIGLDNKNYLGVNSTAEWSMPANVALAVIRMPASDAQVTGATTASGLILGSRRAVNDVELYMNGVSLGADTSTATATNVALNYYLFNRNGTPAFSNARLSFAHFGTGLTDTDAANLSLRVNTLMTALGANVY